MLPAALAGTVAKRWIAPLIRRYGYDTFLLVNTMLVGGAIVGFGLISPSTPVSVAIAVLVVFGAANSMQFAAMNSVTLKDLTHEDAGSGNSLFSMVQMLAMGLGVSIGGALVTLFAGHWASMIVGFRMSFVCLGAITLVAALIFRKIKDVAPAQAAPVRAALGHGR